jgi:hypothetical protein
MPFGFQQIAREWLGDAQLAIPPEQIEAGFNTAEEVLGEEWLEARRRGRQFSVGAFVALPVVLVGLQLLKVRGAPGFDELVANLKRPSRFAYSELAAAAYSVTDVENVQLEFGAHVIVGNRNRRPDFRVALNGEPWTHVEVSAPDRSEVSARAQRMLDEIATRLFCQQRGSTVEVLLLRDVAHDDAAKLAQAVTRMATSEQHHVEEFGDLAVVEVNYGTPGNIEGGRNLGRVIGPTLCIARAQATNGITEKHIVVKTPVTDPRAADFLTKEARKLPRGEPGLVILDMTAATASFDDWEAVLRGRLQPSLHTRVSAVLLTHSGLQGGARHFHHVVRNRLIVNSNAAIPLPPWLAAQLKSGQRSAFSQLDPAE